MSWDTRSAPSSRPSVWTVTKYVIGALWLLAGFAALVSIPVAIVVGLVVGFRALIVWAG